jgi:Uma2 family endonuclease
MASLAAIPDAYRLTFEDWLRLPDDGIRYEVIGGELFGEPPPTWRHQLIATELLFQLRTYFGAGFRGRIATAAGLRLSNEDIVKPDLVVFLEEHHDRIDESAVAAGPPDLTVEILSPGTAGRDLCEKRALYERSGIPEYWIVDPVAETIQVLAFTGGTYLEVDLYQRGNTLLSPLLQGIEIPILEIFSLAKSGDSRIPEMRNECCLSVEPTASRLSEIGQGHES